MSSSISEIPICNIGLLGQSVRHFWLSPLDALLERFPILELPHKQVFYSIILIESAQGEIVIDDDKIRLDEPKLIVVKPQLISSIDINRRAKGTMICFTEDFFLCDITIMSCINFCFCVLNQSRMCDCHQHKNQNGIFFCNSSRKNISPSPKRSNQSVAVLP